MGVRACGSHSLLLPRLPQCCLPITPVMPASVRRLLIWQAKRSTRKEVRTLNRISLAAYLAMRWLMACAALSSHSPSPASARRMGLQATVKV